MENNDFQKVCTILWPFFKYDVLIPKQIDGDIFEWLFLSIVLIINKRNNRPLIEYSDKVKIEALHLLQEKFGSVLEEETLDRIVANSEHDFVLNGKLSPNTPSFLNTYESLFSEELETHRILQDAIGGSTLPKFFRDDFPYERNYKLDKDLKPINALKKPTKSEIGKAYRLSKLLSQGTKYNPAIDAGELDKLLEKEDDAFYDEDAQEYFFESEEEMLMVDGTIEKKKERFSLGKFNVYYYNDNSQREVYYYPIDIYVCENKIFVRCRSFGNETDDYMNRCFTKAVGSNEYLKNIVKDISKNYIKEETINSNGTIDLSTSRRSNADDMVAFGNLYRLVASDVKKEIVFDLKEYLVKMDKKFELKDYKIYDDIGYYLECLMSEVKIEWPQNRHNYTKSLFIAEIEPEGKNKNIDCHRCFSEGVFNDWQRRDNYFKGQIAELLRSGSLVKSEYIYKDFINEIYDLYSKRNDYTAHYKNKKYLKSVVIEDSVPERLLRITKVMLSLQ